MTNPYSPLNKTLTGCGGVIMAEQSAVINDSNLLYLAAGEAAVAVAVAKGERGAERHHGYHNSYRK